MNRLVNTIEHHFELRHKFLENSIAETREVLAHPEVRKSLGEYAVGLSGILDRLFIAEVKNGQIQIPEDKLDTDHIPLVAMRHGEKIRTSSDFYTFTSAQKKQAADEVASWKPRQATALEATEDIVANAAKEIGSHDYDSLDHHTPAAVFFPRVDYGGSLDKFEQPSKYMMRLKLRPTVALKYEGYRPKSFDPAALIHELVHLLQQDRRKALEAAPTQETDENIRHSNELEAYYVGALTIEAMIRANLLDTNNLHPLHQSQLGIEQVRKEKNAKAQSFAVIPELTNQLSHHGGPKAA